MKSVALSEHDTGCQASSINLFTALNQEIIRCDKCSACYMRVESEINNNCIYGQCLLLVSNLRPVLVISVQFTSSACY